MSVMPNVLLGRERKMFLKITGEEYEKANIDAITDPEAKKSAVSLLFQTVASNDLVKAFQQAKGEEMDLFAKFLVSKGVSHETLNKGELITLKQEDLSKLLLNIESRLEAKFKAKSPEGDMKDMVRELVEQLSPEGGTRQTARFEEQIDKEDYLEEPVVFFTYNNYYAIFSEIRYGQEVKTPYGRPIKFSNISTNVSGVGRYGKQTVQIAAAQVQTKKEVEWLRKSPKLNVIFFETIADTATVDKHRASKMAEALESISGLNDYQVMQRAIAKGVPASKDFEKLKYGLLVKLADEAMSNEKDMYSNTATSANSTVEDHLKRTAPAGANVTSY